MRVTKEQVNKLISYYDEKYNSINGDDETLPNEIMALLKQEREWQGRKLKNAEERIKLLEDSYSDQPFIDHIKRHLKEGEHVICKICGQMASEIIESNPRPNPLADLERLAVEDQDGHPVFWGCDNFSGLHSECESWIREELEEDPTPFNGWHKTPQAAIAAAVEREEKENG